MPREIRFRAWHTTTKKMVDLKAITPLAMDASLKQDGLFIPYREDILLMQFTGLRDTNGQDIYEGDTVVIPNQYPFYDEGSLSYIGVVEWIYSQWQIVLKCVNPKKAGISDGINQGLNDEGWDEGVKTPFQIIGNIFVNEES